MLSAIVGRAILQGPVRGRRDREAIDLRPSRPTGRGRFPAGPHRGQRTRKRRTFLAPCRAARRMIVSGASRTSIGLPRPHCRLSQAFDDLSRELLQEEPDVETVERYGTRKGRRQLGIDLLIECKDKSLSVNTRGNEPPLRRAAFVLT